jgi:hypothetical protein
MSGNLNPVGRLALRVEGEWWVAYYALPNTMAGAIEMARIGMPIVQDADRRAAFKELMKSFVDEVIGPPSDAPRVWEEQPAANGL